MNVLFYSPFSICQCVQYFRNDDEIAPTLSAYPLLGAQGNDGTIPATKIGGPVTETITF